MFFRTFLRNLNNEHVWKDSAHCPIFWVFVPKLKAQTDILFWFVAPDAWDSGGKFDLPIVFRFSTLSSPSQVSLDKAAL